MKMIVLLGLALPGAAITQTSQAPASSPPAPCWQERPAPAALPTRPAQRRTERLPAITPAPAWVEKMLAPEYQAERPRAAEDRAVGPVQNALSDSAEADAGEMPTEPR